MIYNWKMQREVTDPEAAGMKQQQETDVWILHSLRINV